MRSNYCIFEYLYRDAGNWKTYACLLLNGQPSPARESAIRRSLDSEALFIPEQIGIPPLQRQHLAEHDDNADGDLDHAFHEFVGIRKPDTSELATYLPAGSIQELIARIEHAGRAGWDVRLSPFGRW